MTHADRNIAASRHAGSAHDAGFPLYALVLALTAGHTVASIALMVLPAVAPAVARDYGIGAALIGYQLGIVGTGQLATLLLVYPVFSLLGITSGAWPGILMAEAGHLAPRAQVSTVISGMLIYVNLGKMLGPAMFAASYALTGSYGIAFGLVGVPAMIAIYCLTAVQRGQTR